MQTPTGENFPKPPPGHRWKVRILKNDMGSLYPRVELQRRRGPFWFHANSRTGSFATEPHELVTMASDILFQRMRESEMKLLAGTYG